MKVENTNIVTASVVSEATEVVGSVPVAPPSPSSPYKGRRCGGPTIMTPAKIANDIDNGQRSAKLAPYLTKSQTDKHDYDNASLLRLRGGNGEISDNTFTKENDMDTVEIHEVYTPHNPKRFKSNSPDSYTQLSSDTIEDALNNVDTTLSNIRTYMSDMIAATKIGKKWSAGMEDFLSEILISTKKIAFEAAGMIGANNHAASELNMAKRQINDLHVRIGELKARDHASIPKSYSNTVGNSSVIIPAPATYGNINTNTPKERIGDFPPLERQSSKIGKSNKDRVAKSNSAKLKAAKSKPVKPVFIVEGKDRNLKMGDIWKVVSSKISNPKIDGCRKTTEGNFVLISSDKETTDAIRSISEGLTIKERGPKKPRLLLKGILIDYTAEFISDTVINQNLQLLGECSATDIRPMFKCGKRNDFSVDWVVEVSPRAYRCINGKRIYVGMISTFTRPYTIAPHCRRCLNWDHRTADCKQESTTCLHCSKPGHNKKDCPNRAESPNCIHCEDKHATMSKDCLKWAARVRALQRNTDYGYQTNE